MKKFLAIFIAVAIAGCATNQIQRLEFANWMFLDIVVVKMIDSNPL